MGLIPIDSNRFLISFVDSFISILSIIHPAYLGQAELSLISILIVLDSLFEKLFTSGNLISLL